VGRQITL
jgi:hypothetical protein